MKHRKKLLLLIMILVLSLFIGNSYAGKCACKFTRYSDNEGGLFKAEKDLVFVILTKPGEEVAIILYETGAIPAAITANVNSGITFVEIVSDGGVTSTTIDLYGNAVHSRNIIIDGKLIPSQYYGNCRCISDKE